jgi:pilus assembly protein CpaE
VLAAPTRVEDAELVRGHHVERTISLLQGEFDWVIIDVSRSWSEASVRALDLADKILLVTLLDVPTLNHTRAHLDLLRRLGHPDSKIRLVANRYSKSDTVTERDFAEFLGRPPDSYIPNDYPTTLDSLNQGKPLGEVAPRSPIHAAYAKLGEELHAWCDVAPHGEAQAAKRGSRFHRIFGKKQNGTD